MIFVVHAVATEFATPITSVTLAIVVTLAMRPVGAFVFGRAVDRYGRRPILVVVIVLCSVLELVSAFSPNLIFLLCVRALFGIAMGGVWGVGASLTMETIPSSARGITSGLLQAGYPTGYTTAHPRHRNRLARARLLVDSGHPAELFPEFVLGACPS